MPPLLLTGIRYTIAGAVMLAVLLLRGERIPRDRRTLGNIALVGLLLIAGGNLALVWAEQWVPSGIASLLVAVGPFWATSFERCAATATDRCGRRSAWRSDSAAWRCWSAARRGRCVQLTLHRRRTRPSARRDRVAGGSVHAKHALKDKVSPLLSAALQSLFGGIVLDVAGLAFGEAARFHRARAR
jgi:hypothetical protein